MKKLQVLISCMHENDFSIVKRSNIQCDAVIINQCDEDKIEERSFFNKDGESFRVKMIYTRERGLSRSRNMAIKNSTADICLICDDDEKLDDDYPTKITKAFTDISEAGLITFIVDYKNKLFPKKTKRLGVVGICKSFSVQMCFRRKDIVNKDISFDVMMGSGSGNGAGEENKFMMDCYRKGIKLFYCPIHIGRVLSANSMWNQGMTEKYFRDRGWTMRRSFGALYGYLFLLYNAINHRNEYTKDGLSFIAVLKNMNIGFWEKR